MVHLRLRIVLESQTGFLQQLWGHGQVALGRADLDVSQIGGQLR
jgi:hypothetical protein